MNAANISLVLRESTGIQMQQSSLNSGNTSIRIQGLDGRYTQLLKDGFPLFGGFSGGLSIMQIPPLDLAQFEIVKGSASTLYGGGAIAGLVNMVSFTPRKDPKLKVMLTQTQSGASTANIFYAKRGEKMGYTLYGAGNYQRPYDPDGDQFTNLPATSTLSLNPKLFLYPSERTRLWLGLNATYDKREGGDIEAVRNGASTAFPYLETNESWRGNVQSVLDHVLSDREALQVRSTVSYFDRSLVNPDIAFAGDQWFSFSEANYRVERARAEGIFGVNLYTSQFVEANTDFPRDQTDVTVGAFGQWTTDLSERWILETGGRLDYSPDWGTFPLPRVSVLWKANPRLSTRLGGGLGYKLPDMFTEDAARLNYADILPLDVARLKAERSYGLNWDLNYRGQIGSRVAVSVNQLFYRTSITNALLLTAPTDTDFSFFNASSPVTSTGAETNIKFSFQDFRLFVNYAFIDVRLEYLIDSPVKPLTPRHNAGSVLMYENEDWRIGYEAYYTGTQTLRVGGSETEDYWMMGLLIQKHFNWGSPYINFENFTDVRQARYSPEVTGPRSMPTFPLLYAPTDGFVFSAGVILQPFGRAAHTD